MINLKIKIVSVTEVLYKYCTRLNQITKMIRFYCIYVFRQLHCHFQRKPTTIISSSGSVLQYFSILIIIVYT